MLFISFGLLLALAWVRLAAPDVALAEAGIGAGLTGALLMAALARLQDRSIVVTADGDDVQSHIQNDFNDDPKKAARKDD